MKTSVVIPVYESAGTVERALRSAFEQTQPPYEVIACDDGSTDNPQRIFARFPNLRVIRQSNAGLASARNAAASVATGDWLAFLDADDYWREDYLASVAAAETQGIDVVATNGRYVHNGKVGRRLHERPPGWLTEGQTTAILRGNNMFLPVVRSTVFHHVGGYDPALRRLEDWDLNIRLMLAGARFTFVDRDVRFYVRHAGTLKTDGVAMRRASLVVIEKALNSDLTADQRSIAEQTVERLGLALQRDVALSKVWAGHPDARRAAWAVSRSADQPAMQRIGFLVAAVSPTLFQRVRGSRRV